MLKQVNSLGSKLSPALLVSVAAMFVALGGSAVAYTAGKSSVGVAQLKNGAVITSKIRNGAVTQSKLANSLRVLAGERGPEGPRGQQGPQGVQGAQGVPGAPGLIDWNGVYEVTTTRVGSGVATAACQGNDQVLFGTASANSSFFLGSAYRNNAGREWRVEISSNPGVISKAIAFCVPN